MSAICVIFAVLITIFVLMLGQYNDVPLNIGIMFTERTYEISFLVLSLIIFAFGILSGVLLILSSLFDTSKRYARLKKEYNKTSIGADDAEDRIELLENKIRTLETALQNALKENN